MATLEENRKTWDGQYKWPEQGDEWSAPWGGPAMQWYGTVLPRIHRFVPAGNILEIACGYGRWTQFLKDLCVHLDALDLSGECIRFCKERFSGSSNIDYHLTDGKSLEMIPDASVDFLFSFDSLVHADETVLRAYLSQMPRILKENGAAFIHHSNFKVYAARYARISRVPGLTGLLTRIGLLEKTTHWRDPGVSAEMVRSIAGENGLRCISQEVLNWGTRHMLIDCFTTVVKNTSPLSREARVFRNSSFAGETAYIRRLSELYSVK